MAQRRPSIRPSPMIIHSPHILACAFFIRSHALCMARPMASEYSTSLTAWALLRLAVSYRWVLPTYRWVLPTYRWVIPTYDAAVHYYYFEGRDANQKVKKEIHGAASSARPST